MSAPSACLIRAHVCTDTDTVEVHFCTHEPLAKKLVHAGIFPATPVSPQMGFDVAVMELYRNLFIHGNTSSETFTSSLRDFHGDRGYRRFKRTVRILPMLA